jgi:hypothetical protein
MDSAREVGAVPAVFGAAVDGSVWATGIWARTAELITSRTLRHTCTVLGTADLTERPCAALALKHVSAISIWIAHILTRAGVAFAGIVLARDGHLAASVCSNRLPKPIVATIVPPATVVTVGTLCAGRRARPVVGRHHAFAWVRSFACGALVSVLRCTSQRTDEKTQDEDGMWPLHDRQRMQTARQYATVSFRGRGRDVCVVSRHARRGARHRCPPALENQPPVYAAEKRIAATTAAAMAVSVPTSVPSQIKLSVPSLVRSESVLGCPKASA